MTSVLMGKPVTDLGREEQYGCHYAVGDTEYFCKPRIHTSLMAAAHSGSEIAKRQVSRQVEIYLSKHHHTHGITIHWGMIDWVDQ